MALKIRQKKQKQQPSISQHSSYTGKYGRNWQEQYREDNQQSVRKSFIMIIAIMVIIVLILILSAVNTFIFQNVNNTQITAADTFAITSYEQEQMRNDARTFAEGILVYAYCADEDIAEEGKIAALQKMAQNSTSYKRIAELDPVVPVVEPSDFAPITTEPVLQDPTMAYAGSFTYTFSGTVADLSAVTESAPNGRFVDSGYNFTVTFSPATDDNGENGWIITDVEIKSK